MPFPAHTTSRIDHAHFFSGASSFCLNRSSRKKCTSARCLHTVSTRPVRRRPLPTSPDRTCSSDRAFFNRIAPIERDFSRILMGIELTQRNLAVVASRAFSLAVASRSGPNIQSEPPHPTAVARGDGHGRIGIFEHLIEYYPDIAALFRTNLPQGIGGGDPHCRFGLSLRRSSALRLPGHSLVSSVHPASGRQDTGPVFIAILPLCRECAGRSAYSRALAGSIRLRASLTAAATRMSRSFSIDCRLGIASSALAPS